MLDLTKPVQTSDGKPVRILCTDAPGDYPIVGCTPHIVLTWTREGYILKKTYLNNPLNLINVPQPSEYRPFKSEEVPVGALFKTRTGHIAVILTICDKRINFIGSNGLLQDYGVENALDLGCKYSLDLGKTWHPFGVLK